MLDLACGGGRHARHLAGLGHPVLAVDRDAERIGSLREVHGIEVLVADLEAGDWPLAGRRFAGVVVTNYLFRPLLPAVVAATEPGGVLVYETFARGNEALGRPANPDHLLEPGELLAAASRLEIVAYEHGRIERPRPAIVQRIAAIRGAAAGCRLAGHASRPAEI